MAMRNLTAILLIAALPLAAAAQSQGETLADIRQELTVLNVELQKLKRELSTTGQSSNLSLGGSALERLDALEAEAQRLTSKTEELEFRINSVVTDGTNRIGDLEFRLVELEGGDVSKLGETSTLGGVAPQGAPSGGLPQGGTSGGLPQLTPPADGGAASGIPAGTELAMAERSDFEAAQSALAGGDHATAAEGFTRFLQTYPGSPLQAQAELGRGKAEEARGETTRAARAYLASFTAAPDGPVAAEALFNVGRSLGQLGQGPEACTTLREVGNRFPGSPQVAQAQAEITRLGCQ